MVISVQEFNFIFTTIKIKMKFKVIFSFLKKSEDLLSAPVFHVTSKIMGA